MLALPLWLGMGEDDKYFAYEENRIPYRCWYVGGERFQDIPW